VIAGVAPYGAPDLDWLSGMGQDNVDEFSAALTGPDTLAPYLRAQHEHLKDITADDIVASLTSLLPDVDRAVLTDEFGQDIASSFREGLKHGINGWLDDDLAFTARGASTSPRFANQSRSGRVQLTSWSRSRTHSGSRLGCPRHRYTSNRVKDISPLALAPSTGCWTNL
jgi:hypothetical protein